MTGIIGTAGHIDHGKTTLVTRLTGVDTDRLPEEKRRGITIALGFAPIVLPDGTRAGVVDVPGHERFVRTMVAGAAGIDVALLVVAADEGVMPQTREHLEICGLLEVERGVVALTKTDKAGSELSELAGAEVAEAVAGTFLKDAPIVPCSGKTGEGLDRLLEALRACLRGLSPRRDGAPFFLPIDRVLSVRGFGTVVTGTVLSGDLEAGEEVAIAPPQLGRRPLIARARSLQEFGRDATRIGPGHRAAIALAGVDRDDVEVGQALIDPGASVPTRRVSVRLRHLASRGRELRSGAKVSLLLGTRAVEAGITLFEVDRLAPGETGFATLRLAEPIACLPGQRFILRGFDAPGRTGRTVGGGVILDPEPPRRRRRDAGAVRVLESLEQAIGAPGGAIEGLLSLVSEAGTRGVGIDGAARRLGVSPARILRTCEKSGQAIEWVAGASLLFDGRALDALSTEVAAIVDRYHEEQPLAEGVALAEITTRLGRGLSTRALERIVGRMIRAGELLEAPAGYRRPGFSVAVDRAGARRAVAEALEAAGLEPPAPSELARVLELPEVEVRTALTALAREKGAVHAGQGLYFSAGAFAAAAEALATVFEEEGPVPASRAKALFGISRKYLIPLLEAFDRSGITVRRGEAREVRRPLGNRPRT